mmetsp:Transcript_45562/g.71389  ORF Transcript_45562/g.71389 Transcript_45562/m.71389 type:complete len:100 (+) Transcript_45562:1183-1482(+)
MVFESPPPEAIWIAICSAVLYRIHQDSSTCNGQSESGMLEDALCVYRHCQLVLRDVSESGKLLPTVSNTIEHQLRLGCSQHPAVRLRKQKKLQQSRILY